MPFLIYFDRSPDRVSISQNIEFNLSWNILPCALKLDSLKMSYIKMFGELVVMQLTVWIDGELVWRHLTLCIVIYGGL